MPRWEVTFIGKKGHCYGMIEARDERDATIKAAKEFGVPLELQFKIAVTKRSEQKRATPLRAPLGFASL